jgi:glycosyltransferase involved in cell wall biosynthesis
MPIRILQVVHGLPRGGLENGVVNLLNHLPADEFEHGVVCLDARGEMADRLAPEVPLWTLGRERHDRRTPGRLACILRDWQPHIVHCHNWNTWPDTVAAHAMAGRTGRLIWSFHGFVDGGGMPWRRRITSHLLARHTHQLLAVCRDAAGRYAGQTAIPAARFGVLYNGVDTPPYANEDGDNNLRVFQSRSGHRLTFDDTSGEERMELITNNEEIRLIWDAKEKVLSVYSGKDIIVEAVETVSWKCKDFILEASNSISMKATTVDVKASSSATVDGGGSLVLTAALTKIN